MKNMIRHLGILVSIISISFGVNAQDIRSRIADVFRSSCRIALILPLNSKSAESVEYNNFIDFYEGVLIAAEDAKEQGVNIEIEVFDSNDYPNLSLLAQSGRLNGCDLIIGPVLKEELEKILPFANEKGIPIVSPLDPRTENLTLDNPLLFQATTPLLIQQSNLLSGLFSGDHVTVISENSNQDTELANLTKSLLTDKRIKFNSFSYVLEKEKSQFNQILSRLDKSVLNHVIIPSGSEAFVYDVLRNLNLLNAMHGYKIKIYGTSKWRNFDLVDLSYFHTMNLALSLNYYTDYSKPEVKKFISRFRALYMNEPSAYAFQAYDITTYFLSYWAKFGFGNSSMNDFSGSYLQSDIRFVKNGSGFVNSATRIVEYLPGFLIESRSSLR